MKKWRFGNILQTSTAQFDGHIRDYFVKNSKRVVALYILPRSGSVRNFIEVYERGKLKKRIELFSPKNVIVAYITYYFQYLFILFRIFPRREKIYFVNHLPIFFFFNSIIRIFRKIEIIYWIADYWPMTSLSIKIFRFLIYFYHARSQKTLYMSDRINKKMNGIILSSVNKKTVMLGIDPQKISNSRKIDSKIKLCFVGVLIESQGIDILLSVVAKNSNVTLNIIGTGEKELVEKYRKLIEKYNISSRVYFPNSFLYGEDLRRSIQDCYVGMALYRVDKNTATYYADPSKIKQYAELGLPIIMTKAAEVSRYIERFHAGIVVERDVKSVNTAIEKIRRNYSYYLSGLVKFNNYFEYERYYNKAFQFLEN